MENQHERPYPAPDRRHPGQPARRRHAGRRQNRRRLHRLPERIPQRPAGAAWRANRQQCRPPVAHLGRPGWHCRHPRSASRAGHRADLRPGFRRRRSAFTGTGLLDELQRRGVETLIIAGYMTHNCVDSTARDAFHRGYRVGVVADASATRDLPGPDGQTISAATVHAAVLAGLGDRIAEIIDVATLAAIDVV
ncbi:MAG: hypothetical protein CVU31_11155 [Betaproteobacteria bacterium HGW-Betaproteobacteria-4]|nr:MAG: hypothetical protein CVU31_11155 [Betaproteobacteria bacterium HGW-Betaproteobacteria-4]